MKRQKSALLHGVGRRILAVMVFTAVSLPLFAEAANEAQSSSGSQKEVRTVLAVSKGAKADRKAAGHFRDWGEEFNVEFVALHIQDIKEDIDVELYDGAIVLSTQEAQGRDSELRAFTERYGRDLPIVFVGLIPNSKSTDYTIAAASDLGVDVVTAATKWGGKILKEMHRRWFYDALVLLSQ